MKKTLLLVTMLSLAGCDRNISKDLETDRSGQFTINGKTCEVVSVNVGSYEPRLLFIDCGPGSASVTYPVGKTHQTVGQYTPPVVTSSAPSCSCPNTTEDLKKIQEIKKEFYK